MLKPSLKRSTANGPFWTGQAASHLRCRWRCRRGHGCWGEGQLPKGQASTLLRREAAFLNGSLLEHLQQLQGIHLLGRCRVESASAGDSDHG
jgi:hypothetical protein